MLICCSCTRYSESIKEIYIVPKNPIGFSHGSFRGTGSFQYAELYFGSEERAREAINAVGEDRVKKYYLEVQE